MKKLIILAFFALSVFAAGANKDMPIPMCDPCPWVR